MQGEEMIHQFFSPCLPVRCIDLYADCSAEPYVRLSSEGPIHTLFIFQETFVSQKDD